MRPVGPLLAVVLLAATAPARAERLSVPYEMFRLKNGLTVIVHEDHSAPIASVNCWYHVGSARERHCYTYGAASRFARYRTAGVLAALADVQTDKTAPALTEFMNELARIRTPPTAEEAARARSYAALRYPEQFETTQQVAARVVEKVVYDLPDGFFEQFVPKALAVDAAAIQKAADADVDPRSIAIVVGGDRAKVEAPIRALNLGPIKNLTVEDVMGPAPKLD